MATPRAVPCKYLRMRPMAVATGGGAERKPASAAICENAAACAFGKTLDGHYEAAKWLELDICRTCTQYAGMHR